MDYSPQTTTTTTMPPPQNPTDSTHEAEPNNKTHSPEPENPFSLEKPSESKNSESDVESAASVGRSNSLELNKGKEVKVKEKGPCAATVQAKSDGTVEDAGSSTSGRERLKRLRVEVAGRVWIPDMWGQEDFLNDWADCAAFDASLVNSSIILARDSLMEEGRRANSTRLRIQNGY